MKAVVSALVLALALVSNTAQAEEGKVAGDTLAAMGLSSMQTMSDSEGESIRGTASYAFGIGLAVYVSPFSGSFAGELNGYGAFAYPNFATGSNYAQAGSLLSPFFGVYATGTSSATGN